MVKEFGQRRAFDVHLFDVATVHKAQESLVISAPMSSRKTKSMTMLCWPKSSSIYIRLSKQSIAFTEC